MTFIRFRNLPKTTQPKSVKTHNSLKNNYLITGISSGEWGNGEWEMGKRKWRMENGNLYIPEIG